MVGSPGLLLGEQGSCWVSRWVTAPRVPCTAGWSGSSLPSCTPRGLGAEDAPLPARGVSEAGAYGLWQCRGTGLLRDPAGPWRRRRGVLTGCARGSNDLVRAVC